MIYDAIIMLKYRLLNRVRPKKRLANNLTFIIIRNKFKWGTFRYVYKCILY